VVWLSLLSWLLLLFCVVGVVGVGVAAAVVVVVAAAAAAAGAAAAAAAAVVVVVVVCCCCCCNRVGVCLLWVLVVICV